MLRSFALLPAIPLFVVASAATGADAPATDLRAEIVGLQPPSGSTLRVGQPVVVTLRYRYARPGDGVLLWAKLLEPGLRASYQGAGGDSPPGSGLVERSVTLDEPGTATTLTLVAKDRRFRPIASQAFPVRYTWVPNPRVEAARDDGLGARVVGVRLTPASPAVLKVGTKVDVQIDVADASARGLQPWVEPLTTCDMTYDGRVALAPGQTRVHRGFTVGQPCAVTHVKVGIKNAANVEVFARTLDVDLRYVD